MAALSSGDRLQVKVANASADPVTISLDNPCQEASTVLIEATIGGLPITDGGLEARVPDGFALDARDADWYHYVFRKPAVAAGEQSWQFSSGIVTDWLWRVSEWTPTLEPVSPTDAVANQAATVGSAATSKSTGTTLQNGRSGVVCLAWHFASLPSATSGDWLNHTNSFVETEQSSGVVAGWWSSWSWLFADPPATFECTADLSATPRSASDILTALLVVYAAAQPDIVPGPTVVSS